MVLTRGVPIVLVLALAQLWVQAQTSRPAAESTDVRILATRAALERTISTGQVHRYALSVVRNDFLHVTIAQQGIDLVAIVIRPEGSELVTVEAADDDFRRETVVAIADADGHHTLIVRPVTSTTPAGRYTIRLEELRPAAPMDAERIEAERAYERGHAQARFGEAGAYEQGIDDLEAALKRYRGLRDRSGELKTLIDLAAIQARLVRPETLATAQEAERLARLQGDPATTSAAIMMLGMALDRAGDRLAARQAYDEALTISRTTGNRKAQARVLNQQGTSHGRAGDGEVAVASFEEALELARATGYRTLEWVLNNNLGITYKNLGEFERALDAYRSGLSYATDTGNTEARAILLNNMGNLERLLGNHEGSLALQKEALALSQEVGIEEHVARSLNTIGQAHYWLGDYDRALDHHRRSLQIRRRIGDLAGIASSLYGEGRALHRLGQSDRAETLLEEARGRWRHLREQLGEMDALRELAVLKRDRGDLAAALEYVQMATDLEETVRRRITSPALRASFNASERDTYGLFIDVLQRLHAADPSGGHDARALHVAERARARVLLESALDVRIDLRAGVEPALLERERTLQDELETASTRLSRALAVNASAERVEPLARAVEQLSWDYERLQAEVRQQSPKYAAVTQPAPLAAAEIQRTVLDEQTVLLEFALGEERSWLWAATPAAITSVELPPMRVIEAAARSLYDRLTARRGQPGEPASRRATRVAEADAALAAEMSAISHMLLDGISGPLSGEWRGKRLAIVATGALEYLPFGALPLPAPTSSGADGPDAGGRTRPRPLIAEHEIVTIPSASVLAVLRRETGDRQPAPRSLAMVADPVFERADPRVGRAQDRRPGGHQVSTAAAGSSTARQGLGRLPFSREEAEAIAALAPTGDVFKATDFGASRTTVLAGALSGYRMVHFATHGVLDSARPSLSSLVLSLVDERGAPINGYLRLHDIYNLRLDADLVVLSACQTALGKEIRGEGLVGLTRAFMYAGAPRVVASLWEVNDVATAELMKAFYRGMLRQRLAPAAALRAAQLELSRNPRWASPYYWAGFTLQGDWK